MSYEQIESLVKNKISEIANLEPSKIDTNDHPAQYVVDSVKMIKLAIELAEILKIDYEPTLIAEYESIKEMIEDLNSIVEKSH
jgi:acyl carrier protein